MPTLSQEFEPVVSDPRKNARTALLLVAIMVVSAVGILYAYNRHARQSERSDRPAIIHRISERKDIVFVDQSGKAGAMLDDQGKVIVVHMLVQSAPDELTTGIMRELAAEYASNPHVVLYTFVLDPGPPETLVQELRTTAAALGATHPRWRVVTNERDTLHRFIKNELKVEFFPHQKADGSWVYDRSLVVVDRSRHVRRPVVPQRRGGAPYVASLNFHQALDWDRRGIKTGTEQSNFEALKALLKKTVEQLLSSNDPL